MPASDLSQRIYHAQCFGSVEPIEHMVPYPNLGTLVAGQNIKLARRMWYIQEGLDYAELLRRSEQAAEWLASLGIGYLQRVLLHDCPTPAAEILAFGIWAVGAVVVLTDSDDWEAACAATEPRLVITGTDLPGCSQPLVRIGPAADEYPRIAAGKPLAGTRRKALLSDEALVLWTGGRGIRLSHYNLLVNANGVRRLLVLEEGDRLRIDLPAVSSAWAVLQAILPIYAGAALDPAGGNRIFGLPSQFAQPEYLIRFGWRPPVDETPPALYIVPENTAVVRVGARDQLMTEARPVGTDRLLLRGHSVMQGYLDEALNERCFREEGLVVKIDPAG